MDLLEQVTREHEHFQAGVDEFQLWLKAVVEKVSSCLGRNCKLTTEGRLCALQVNLTASLPEGECSATGLLCCLFTGMCWGPQGIQEPRHAERTRGDVWNLAQ